MIPVFSILNFEYLGGKKTKYENILTRWSGAHAGSNYVKKMGVQNLVGLSL